MKIITALSFLFFTGLVALISWWKTRGDDLGSQDGYFLGGRSLTGVVIGGSLMLTNLSTEQLIGLNAQGYTDNMCVMAWEVTTAIVLVIVALVFLPKYLKGGFTTIPDFLEERFDSSVKRIATIIFLLGYILNLLPPILYTGAVALSGLFDVPQLFGISYMQGIWLMVWAIGTVGSIYAIFGGLKAVAVSDTINGIGLLIGGLMVPFFGFMALGEGNVMNGIGKLVTEYPEKLNAIGAPTDPVPIGTVFTGMLVINLFYWGTNQSIIQRALGAKNLKEGQKGVLLAGVLKIIGPLFLIVPGIIAFAMYGPGLESGEVAYPALVKDVLPKPLLGFFAAVLFGAILSSFNSVLNSAVTLFSLNIYRPIFKPKATDHELVGIGKKFGIGLAIFAMTLAPFIYYAPQGFFQYFQTINSFYMAPMFTIMFVGFFTKKVPPLAVKVGLAFFFIAYSISTFVLKVDMHFLYVSFILFVVTTIIMLIIGKIKPMDKEYVPIEAKVVELVPWKYAKIVGFLVILIMLSMYILFSKWGIAA
ncbi:solute:sodium symporter family transporter [Clostridium sediminicola]|uniref:solute:sodium symporter family transporter n=1 Tax=Clostridium sediminicola TaxID=3114879 RepID=UPI0031F22FAD